MRPYHLSFVVILMYWQLGPLPQATTDSDGRTFWSLSGMAGKGRWEDASFDCNGALVEAQPAPYRDVGVRLDVDRPASRVHVTVAAGLATNSRDLGGTRASYTTPTLGALISTEGRRMGIGFGIARNQFGEIKPAIRMRLGDTVGTWFQSEITPLTETLSMSGSFRFGIGFKAGMIGITTGPMHRRTSQAALFADFGVPISEKVDLRIAGLGSPGVKVGQWGFAAGLRLHN